MRASLLSVIAVLAVAVLPDRGATALRVAFVSDTGIGNDNPGVWTDWRGNKQGYYKLNGVDCLDFAGERHALKPPCDGGDGCPFTTSFLSGDLGLDQRRPPNV